jgi:hypothetical protein
MQTRWISLLVVVFTVFAVRARFAGAADERLLVVVESTPGTGIDPREVRQTVGAELGIPVVAPEDATAGEASNVLIVSVDKADIRMSLRGSAAGLIGRTIPAPLDRPTRLREIGWLAGNLARDQVSGIVAVPAARDQTSTPLTVAAGDPGNPGVATEPRAPASASADSHAGVTVERAEPAATLAGSTELSPPAGVGWLITVAGGPTANTYGLKKEQPLIDNNDYQLEIERQSPRSRLIFGAALDVGAQGTGLGLAGFLGSSWRHGRWFLEATAGVGLALWGTVPHTTVTNSSLTGESSVTTVSPSAASEPEPFACGVGELGYSITTEVDLLARVGGHLATLTDTGGDWYMDFISAGVGLRVRLP